MGVHTADECARQGIISQQAIVYGTHRIVPLHKTFLENAVEPLRLPHRCDLRGVTLGRSEMLEAFGKNKKSQRNVAHSPR
ncbi:hypothetical protein KM043_002987 [Ampulex compressa]|nr:hypothetical protein KM043_002987 [Ampulex compressa]